MFQSRLFVAAVVILAVFMLSLGVDPVKAQACGTKRGDFTPIDISLCVATPRGIRRARCNNISRRCLCQHNAPLKWVGSPCNKNSNDGGCQCNTYCGYKCKSKCINDPRKQCAWDAVASTCFNRNLGGQGLTSTCWVTNRPTTPRPTNQPTTNQPTSSPTTGAPSASPTTGAPSSTPSQAPYVPTPMPSRGPGSTLCHPGNGLKKKQCLNRVAYCATQNIDMKFTGAGCVVNGVRQRDGGCQCGGYCGFKCETACNRDPTCWWHTERNECVFRATNVTGQPIPVCLENPILT